MTTITIYDLNNAPLNAQVDITPGQLVLHSMSGDKVTGRNPDYRLALEIIIDRLRKNHVKFDVYLDSAPAAKAYPDLQDRFLLESTNLDFDLSDAAMQLIRKSNEGSASHGAWRRLLFQVEGHSEADLIDRVSRDVPAAMPIRAGDFVKVQRQHIEAAIAEIRSGKERPNRFEVGRDYSLIVGDGGDPLPPKKVFGLALAIALDRPVEPEHFSSGESIFKVLEGHGFQVIERVKVPINAQEDGSVFEREDIEPILPLDEELTAVEGSKRLRIHFATERSSSLPRRFKQDFKARNGRLICFRCAKDYVAEYGEELADACFDVHHIEQLSEREAAAITSADQLQLLCSNCHRVTHREMKLKITPSPASPR